MRQFGVRPDRELGQNFLIDSNILGVIERAAELRPQGDGRVLEIGGGWACSPSTSRSAPSTCTWSRSTSGCARRCSTRPTAHANVSVHWADAMTIDLAALTPAPTKVVANLPYGVAAGACCARSRSCHRSSCGWRWCSARSASGWRRAPGSAAYGAVGDRAARLRGARRQGDPPHACSIRCRTSTRCSSTCAVAGPRRMRVCARSWGRVRAPAQDARDLAGAERALGGLLARADAGGA